MFLSLHTRPKNPRHFVALCFLRCKDDPSLKLNNSLVKKVAEFNNLAIFECAYGFFIANKKQEFSLEFHSNLADLKKKIGIIKKKIPLDNSVFSDLDLPSGLKTDWTW